MRKKERIRLFVEEMWAWYGRNKRILPWRDLTDADPTERAYKVMVSEIMLQQTQVPRVIIIYKEFLRRFPTLGDLAKASNKEVLMAWRGMGYNSRALRLRDAAKIIRSYELRVTSCEYSKPETRNPKPQFPREMEELTAIPGIGEYTAAAIRNFAFNIPTPCIDTNIRRILHRTFFGPENADGSWEKDDEYLLKVAGEVLEEAIRQKGVEAADAAEATGVTDASVTSVSSVPSVASEWHAALMDFGSLVQTKRNPRFDICPLTEKRIMRTTRNSFESSVLSSQYKVSRLKTHNSQLREPGRYVGSTFTPNRIFRGRVIDALRDAPKGLTLHDIGKNIAIDWDPDEHQEWLRAILLQLSREAMLGEKRGKYVL